MKVSFVLLAHEAPDALRPLIETLLASGSDVYVHHDANSPHDLKKSAAGWQLERFGGRLLHAERVKVVWGEWSIVQATLNCMRLARQEGYNADYFMLLSGSCMPVKPIRLLEDHLKDQGELDYVEAVNVQEKRWITRGIQQERWEKFHYVNWRNSPKLFSLVLDLQKRLKIKRSLPLKHIPFMGSQWWCLRASTVGAILALLDQYPELAIFYRRTWVPDELFFQTMVGNLIPLEEISPEILTRYKFNSSGIPRVYYDDDLPELMAESTFFARKISHRAPKLKKALSEVCMLPEKAYRQLMSDAGHQYAINLRKKLHLEKEMRDAAWFGLATSKENQYDYIKSIPNPMIVVVSADVRVRQKALDELRRSSDTVVYGDILDGKQLDFGDGTSVVAGYGAESVKLARNKWHLFLGELAFHAKGKTIAFSLGDDPLPYLTVLSWKVNLTVIMLDEDAVGVPEDADLTALYAKSQVSYVARKFTHCRFARLPFAAFCEITRTHRVTGFNTDEYSSRLANASIRNNWPVLYPQIVDQIESMKFFPNPMLVVVAPDERTGNVVLRELSQHEDVTTFESALAMVLPDQKNEDWQSYLGDMARIAGKSMAAFVLGPEHGSYMKVLRWKKNLAVLVVEQPLVEAGWALEDMRGMVQENNAINAALGEVSSLLQESAHCEVYSLRSGTLEEIENVLETFREHCTLVAA